MMVGLRPVTIAYFRFIIGLIGIALIGVGDYAYTIVGLSVFHLAIFLDLTDGEVFRYRTWKNKGKKEDVLIGSYLDKTFDHLYRPLLLLVAGIGSWLAFDNLMYLFFGVVGALLISEDQIIKLRLYEILAYKQEFSYLKEQKQKRNAQWGKYDLLIELFRINNPFTLYFWFGIFGYLHYFLLIYTPLLFLLLLKTGRAEIRKVNRMDKEIVKRMYG